MVSSWIYDNSSVPFANKVPIMMVPEIFIIRPIIIYLTLTGPIPLPKHDLKTELNMWIYYSNIEASS